MAELRYNPLLGDWIMVASHRQGRPQMPKDWCPFCPGSGKVPDNYDVYKYDNDFPALMQSPPEPDNVETELYKTKECYGKCEVILYSSDHTKNLSELEVPHIRKLVDLWEERFVDLRKDPKLKYVLIFENHGEVVGVTMPHPHGQIYAYSVIPLKIQVELENCKKHFVDKKSCLLCDILKDERSFKERIVIENEHFTAFLPFFTEYPYGMYIISNNHKQNLAEFTDNEKDSLADMLKKVTGTMDNLFGYSFPYVMCMHQNPVNGEDTSDYYHFHIEFYPPMRSADKVKFLAASELGAWGHCNTTAPEEKAQELREAYSRFMEKEGI